MPEGGHHDVVIVGAGPAGLSVAGTLRRAGVPALVLDRGRVGQTWRDVYPFVRLHTRREAAALVGRALPPTAPVFPDRAAFLAYLEAYARDEDLHVHGDAPIERVRREGDLWRLEGPTGSWSTRQLVWAAGVWSAPVRPTWSATSSFAGRAFHVADAWRLDELEGRRVVIVGAGNSAKDVAVAAARVAERVVVSVRDGAAFVPYPSRWTQPLGSWLRRWPARWVDVTLRAVRRPFPDLGLPWPSVPMHQTVPVVGFELVEEVRAGRVGVRPEAVGTTRTGVRFAGGGEEDCDVLVYATGFRPAVDPVQAWLTVRTGGLWSTHPDLHLVGANYPALETFLQQLRREAPEVARAVAARILAVAR